MRLRPRHPSGFLGVMCHVRRDRHVFAISNSHFADKRGGGRVRGESVFFGGRDDSEAGYGIDQVLGREPTPTELAATMRVADEHGLMAVCRALYNCNEFLFIP